MKKKIITTIKLYVVFSLVSVIGYSCCPEQKYQIQNIRSIELFELNTTSTPDSEVVLTGEFTLIARFDINNIASSNINVNLIPSAYAFHTYCDNTSYINELNLESLKISLDKDFIYDGNIIHANSNLIEITEIANNIDLYLTTLYVDFLNEFLEKSQFENQEYNFTFSIETTDGLQFDKEISATLNL
ncbi:hypothetical protein [Aquimarina sp. 433]